MSFCQPWAAADTKQNWWPTAFPTSNLSYNFDISGLLQPQGDSAAIASLVVEPSGSGEMQALDLSVDGYTVTAQLSGGVAGRVYTCQLTVTGVSSRVYVWVIYIAVSSAGALPPAPAPPPSPGFGTAITWSSGATVFGTAIAAVATGLVATGTNQATAFVLTAQTNIFATVAAGTGAILPGGIVSGTIVVVNQGANALLVYPPVGAQIGALGENVAVAVSIGQCISFSTQSPATQWFAAGWSIYG